ncbi:hypothetical protein [Shewanella sp. GD03713]|uniref:hypothetical protein n=1 Tax=Shewanella TaxID=22 RepID=UPI002448720A|nr:hypothetical protein [Shewanella sp. GD03713]MDH1472585.1 hypothetical protein [Shewanella sp. GD03713]
MNIKPISHYPFFNENVIKQMSGTQRFIDEIVAIPERLREEAKHFLSKDQQERHLGHLRVNRLVTSFTLTDLKTVIHAVTSPSRSHVTWCLDDELTQVKKLLDVPDENLAQKNDMTFSVYIEFEDRIHKLTADGKEYSSQVEAAACLSKLRESSEFSALYTLFSEKSDTQVDLFVSDDSEID